MELSKKTNLFLLILFLLVLFGISFRYQAQIIALIKEPEQFKELLLSYGRASILVFIAFQTLQVIIATIPGELIQLAGGYIYGTFAGTLYSLIGILLGYLCVFGITRLIGYPLVQLFVSREKIEQMKALSQTERFHSLLFLLFLIPGVPKDFLVYGAGLTPVEPVKFFVIVSIARFPAILGSSFMGAHLEKGNYTMVGILFALSVILFLAGFIWRERIFGTLEKIYAQRNSLRKKSYRERQRNLLKDKESKP